ncbi:MAG: hypothetical protein JWO13_1382 [Acidobacteriales bacterium]|nr:hypothetical protein [Terriglobales bacterium]
MINKLALFSLLLLLSTCFAQKTSYDDLYRRGSDAVASGDAIRARDAFCEIIKSDPEYKDAKEQCDQYTVAAQRTLNRYKINFADGMAYMQRGDYDSAEIKFRAVKAGEYADIAKQKLAELQPLKRDKLTADLAARESVREDVKRKQLLYDRGYTALNSGEIVAARDAYCELARVDARYNDAEGLCATFTTRSNRLFDRMNQDYEEGLAFMQGGDYSSAEIKFREVTAGDHVNDAHQHLVEIIKLKLANKTGQSAAAAIRGAHSKWLAKTLENASTIKPGMARNQLLALFVEQGGYSASSRTHRTYIYKSCPYIAVDVEFTPVLDSENKATESPRDKIAKISRPYLAYPIYD